MRIIILLGLIIILNAKDTNQSKIEPTINFSGNSEISITYDEQVVPSEFNNPWNIFIKSSKKIEINFGSCILKIPTRYSLVNLNNYHNSLVFSANKAVVSDDNNISIKDMISKHIINVYSHREKVPLKDSVLFEGYKLISTKNISGITLFRYKHIDDIDFVDVTDKQQLNLRKMNKKNNQFLILGDNFSVQGFETDEYFSEIYEIIEDCASQ